jgi:hypothetical protein
MFSAMYEPDRAEMVEPIKTGDIYGAVIKPLWINTPIFFINV